MTKYSTVVLALSCVMQLLASSLSAQRAPSVREIVPSAAPRGARVIVSGKALDAPDVTVMFGSEAARIVERAGEFLEVIVPATANSGFVRVVAGQNVIGETSFTVTPSPPYRLSTLVGAPEAGVLRKPWDVAVIKADGSVIVVDTEQHTIRWVSPTGEVSSLAGNGRPGLRDGKGTEAQFRTPRGIAYDGGRDVLYVSDSGNNAIRRLTRDGTVSTLIGSDSASKLNGPLGLTVAEDGSIYVVDAGNSRICRITPAGEMTTFAGAAGGPRPMRDGPLLDATFNEPRDIVYAGDGVFYVADAGNDAVRRIAGGLVTTVLASPPPSGTDRERKRGGLNRPSGIAVEESGDLLVVDSENDKVRRITMGGASPSLITVAGTGRRGFLDGASSDAQMHEPVGIDSVGALVVADKHNDAVRHLCPELRVTGLFAPAGVAAGRELRVLGTGFVAGDTAIALGASPVSDITWISSTEVRGRLPKTLRDSIVTVTATGCGSTAPPAVFSTDRNSPVLAITDGGLPIADGAVYGRPVVPVITSPRDPSATVTATLNGEPFDSGTAVEAEGTHSIRARAVDAAGNATERVVRFTIDVSPPLVEVLESGRSVSDGAEFDRPVVFTFAVSDRTATLVEASINNDPYTPGETFGSPGSHSLSAIISDAAGNVTRVSSLRFVIHPPAISLQILHQGAPLPEGWIGRGPVTPEFVVDGVEGAVVVATLNGEPFVPGTTISADGRYTLRGETTAGAAQAERTVRFTIDATPPVVEVLAGGTVLVEGASLDPPAVLTLRTTDLTSTSSSAWIDEFPYVPGSSFSIPGLHRFTATVVDAAANERQVGPITFTIAEPALTLTITNGGAPLPDGAMFRTTVVPVLVASGVAGAVIEATLNAEPFTSGTPVNADGRYTLFARATAGTHHVQRTLNFTIDATRPEVEVLEGNSPLQPGATFDRPVVMTLRVEDLTDTTRSAEIDGQAYTLGSEYAVDGVHAFTARVLDALGNETSVGPIPFTIAIGPLTLSITNAGTPLVDGSLFKTPVVPLIVASGVAGATVEATLNDQPFTSGTTVTADGVYTLVARASAGVHDVERTVRFTIDATPPAVEVLEGSTTLESGATFDRPVVITLRVEDLTDTTRSAEIDGQAYALGSEYAVDGAHEFTARVLDALGNETSVGPIPFTIATGPLTLSITNAGTPLVDGSLFKAPVVPVIVASGVAGATVEATLNGQPFTSGTEVNADGVYTLVARALAGAHQVERTVRFTIDATPPEVEVLEGSTTLQPGATFDRPVVITLRVEDLTDTTRSGEIDGQAYTLGSEYAVDGAHAFTAQVLDALGNETSVGPIPFTIATGPLTLSIMNAGTPLVDGSLFKAPVVPVIVASGVAGATVEATLNGQPFTSGTAVTADGVYTLVARATASGHEVERTVRFTIDGTPPAVEVLEGSRTLQSGAMFDRPVVITLRVEDLTDTTRSAEIDGQAYTLGSEYAVDGAHAFTARVLDALGNETSVGPIPFTIATGPLTLSITNAGTPLVDGSLFKAPVVPVIVASGIAGATVEATLNGQPFTSGTEVTADGVYTLVARASAGAREVERTVHFTIDATPPAVEVLEGSTTLQPGATFDRPVVITLRVDDLTDTTRSAAIDGEAYTLGSEYAVDGVHAFTGQVLDALGNETSIGPIPFTIATGPLTLSITNAGTPLVDGSLFKTPVVPLIVASGVAGATVEATLNGQPFTSGTTVTADGMYTLAARASAGAHQVDRTVHFTIDATTPVISVFEGITPFVPGSRFDRAVIFNISVADLTLVTTNVTIDGVVYASGEPFDREGIHQLVVRSTDALANEATYGPVEFTIEFPPATQLAFTSHANDQVLDTRQITLGGIAGGAAKVAVNGIDATIDQAANTFSIPFTLLEGENVISAVSDDHRSATLRLYLDTRAPVLTTAALPACTRAETIAISGTVVEPHLQSILVSAGTSDVAATITGSSWSALIPAGEEGRRSLTVRASDRLGHEAALQLSLNVDRTAPTITILENGVPFTRSHARDAVRISVRGSDRDATVEVEVTLDGQPFTSGAEVIAEGLHTIAARAVDCAGNERTGQHTFVIDRTPPRFLSFSPASGSRITQIPARLTGTVSPDAIEIRLDGRSVDVANGVFDIETRFADGLNEVNLEVLDRAGNVGSDTYLLAIRTTAPLVEIVEGGSTLTDGAVYRRPVVPEIRVFETGVTATATVDGLPFTSGTTIDAAGAHTISATAVDAAFGSQTTVTRSFLIDSVGPAVQILEPRHETTTDAEQIDVRVAAADAEEVRVNGISAARDGEGNWIVAGIVLDVGENALVATAHDAAGNSGRAMVTVLRRSGGPALILTFPPEGFLTNRPAIDVIGRVLRPGTDVRIEIPPAAPTAAVVDAAGNFRVHGARLKEGQSTIRAVASQAESSTVLDVRVTADFTPPALRVLASGVVLEDGARLAAPAVITAQATDAGQPVPYELVVDGTPASSAVTVDSPGSHTAVALARDSANNVTRVERTFLVGSSNSTCALSGFDPVDGAVIAAERVELIGSSGGSPGVKVNGVAATVAVASFSATVELPVEGANVVEIVCTDTAGAVFGVPVHMTIHRATTAPTVSITSPGEHHATADESIAVNGVVSEGVSSVDVNGIAAVLTGTNWRADDVRLQAGLNVLTARARTRAGRTAVASRRVVAFHDEPGLNITSPVPGAVNGAVTIDVSGTWTNLDPATITVVPAASRMEPNVWSDTSGRFTAFGVSLLPGNNQLVVRGRDRLGRLAEASVTVAHASGASISITDPGDNRYFGDGAGDLVRIRGTFAGDDGSVVEVNGIRATIDTAAGTFEADVPFADVAAGMTPVVARVIEPGTGGGAFDSIRVFRLRGPPRVLETYPARDAAGVDPGAVVLVLFSAPMERTSTVAALRVEAPDGSAINGSTLLDDDVLTFAPSAPLIAGQMYTIHVSSTATDRAGQPLTPSEPVTFVVSGSAPAAPPTIDTPSADMCAPAVEVTGSSAPSSRVRLDYDNVSFATVANPSGAFRYVIPLSGRSGYHVIRVRTVGADGSLSPAAELKVNVTCEGPRVIGAVFDRATNVLAIRFSTPVHPDSLPGGVRVDVQGRPVPVAITTTGAEVFVTPAEDLAEQTFTLTVSKAVEDLAGRPLEEIHVQVFAAGGGVEMSPGQGLLSGEVFDASTGRPLAGAQVAVIVAGAEGEPPRGVQSDTLGRYALSVPEGAHTIHVTASGFTRAWRQIVVPAGGAVVPIDIRLARIGVTETTGPLGVTLTHGGGSIATSVTLSVPAGAASEGTAVTLTSLDGQSLPGLLPLGWSPLAAATVESPAPLPQTTLTFEIPGDAIVAAAVTLTAVEYDPLRDQWRVIVPAVNVGDQTASFIVSAGGDYALVYPDRAPASVPAIPAIGAVLKGVIDPCATNQCPALTATEFSLAPPVVLPNGTSVATLRVVGSGEQQFPSGRAVQAYVDEELHLVDGRRELGRPFVTDLLLFRDVEGESASASFSIAPSARATQVTLEVGFENVRVVPYPGRVDRGTLIGPEGGSVPSDGGLSVSISAGATPVELRATAASIQDAESLGPVAGYRVVSGFDLTLQRVAQPEAGDAGVQVPVELSRPAVVTVYVSDALVKPESQLILAELIDAFPFGGRVVRLASEMVRLDEHVWVTKQIDRAVLPLDGVVREGRYLLLAAVDPVAFATGLVRTSAGTAAAGALVRTPHSGVADFTRASGLFAIAVPASPAPPFALVPRTLASGDGATYVHPTAPPPSAVVQVGDLTVVPQPPVVISTSPPKEATGVGLVPTIDVIFSPAIDPSSVTESSLAVIDHANAAVVPGVVSPLGTTGLRFVLAAGETLRSDARYLVTVSPTVRGPSGAPLERAFSFWFRTAASVASDDVHPERIRITIPDAAGVSTISGSAGALKGGWLAVPIRRGGADFVTRYSATAAADGSFALSIGSNPRDRVAITDEIDLRVLNTNGALVAVVPLTPFVGVDGRSFIAPAERASRFTTADGITIDVPAGAFDVVTLIDITVPAPAAFDGVPALFDELEIVSAVVLSFEGRAKQRLQVTLPATASGTDGRYFLARLGESVRGPRLMAVDTLFAIAEGLTTARPESRGAAIALSAAAAAGADVKDLLLGIDQSGSYAAVQMKGASPSSVGFAWAVLNGIAEAVDLFWDTAHSMYVSHEYAAQKGTVAFPVPADRPFRLLGVDAATSVTVLDQAYAALPVGAPGTVAVLSDATNDVTGPHPVFASPGRIEVTEVPPPGLRLEPVHGVSLELSDSGTLTVSATGTAPEAQVSVLNATNGERRGPQTLPIQIASAPGDRLVLVFDEHDVDPRTRLSIVFNEPIVVGTGETEAALRDLIAIDQVAGPASAGVDVLNGAVLRLDSGDRRISVLRSAPLAAGARFRVTLRKGIRDRSSNGLGLGQAGRKEPDGSIVPIGPAPQDLTFWFATRAPAGVLAEFEIRQDATTQLGAIRDIALHGNLLFVAAVDGGILAYDVSDPAALHATPENVAKPLAVAPGLADGSATAYWNVQVDHHGRVFTTGIGHVFGALRTFRVEDFVRAKAAPDCHPRLETAVCNQVGAATVSQNPGSSFGLGLAGALVLSDGVEAIPRKLKIAVVDAAPAELSGAAMIAMASSVADAGNGLKVFDVTVPAENTQYRIQRITIENVTLGLRWSADATAETDDPILAPARFSGVIAAPTDVLRVTRNLSTHAVVSLFGYGVGVYDVNAIESNDRPKSRDVAITDLPAERLALRSNAYDPPLAPNATTITDLAFSPEAQLLAGTGQSLNVYALDAQKGIAELGLTLPRDTAPARLSRRGETVFNASPRYVALREAVIAAGNPQPLVRFNSAAAFNDGTGSYLLIPALELGLLVIEAGAVPLSPESFADVVWFPHGAYAARVVEGAPIAVVVDGEGAVHLVDLTRLDERAVVGDEEMFPTALGALQTSGESGIGSPDPRITWSSAPGLAGRGGSGAQLAPIFDPETGLLYTAEHLGKRMTAGFAADPRLRFTANLSSAGVPAKEVGSIVPLGIEPPAGVLQCSDAAKNAACRASLAVFRLEATLPGSMAESLGGELRVAIESERTPGVGMPQTPEPYPPAHLRLTDAKGSADSRPTSLPMRRVVDVAGMPELRYQRAWNRFASDWIVSIADPRAAAAYGVSPPDCPACARPKFVDATAPELFTTGHFVRTRFEFSSSSVYAQLAANGRGAARVTTTPADTVRPRGVAVAAQNAPVVEGILQEMTYAHSGEVESSAIDYDAGGRAGWDVIISRIYRSRTVGLTALGSGWDSPLFRRLRPLPNGDVEYRDGADIWTFKFSGGIYTAPPGLFLRLVKRDGGWSLVDQKFRVATFDDRGRLTSESDEFFTPRDSDSGNTIQYFYDSDAARCHVVDPVGRTTTLDFDAEGRLSRVTDWHDATPRSIQYDYGAGLLTAVRLPAVENTSGTRPVVRYTYDASSKPYKESLELTTNLMTITDPGEAAARVRFAYDSSDHVTSQRWATGEEATFDFAGLPVTSSSTDALGQIRTYTFTDAENGPLQVAGVAENVEIWGSSPAGELPLSVAAGAPSRTSVPRLRRFTYENGVLKSSELVGLRTTNVGWTSPGGAPGLVMESNTTSPVGTAAAKQSLLPSQSAITRTYRYQSSGAFLSAVEAGGKRIETSEPHRENLQPMDTNDSIVQKQEFDAAGRLKRTTATGGTDSSGAGAEVEIDYWPDDAPEHKRGLPRVVRSGPLASTFDYHSETRTVEVDARGVITTTDVDTWNRPVAITTVKPGDPLVLHQSFTYDAAGRVVTHVRSRKDGDDVTTRYEYDAIGRQTAVTVSPVATVGSATTRTFYELASHRIRREQAGGAETITELDRLGRDIRSVTSTGSSPVEQQYAYDIAGNQVFSTDMFVATASAFDVHGRVIGTLGPDGTVTTATHDEFDRVTAVQTHTAGGTEIVSSSEFDFTSAGRLQSVRTRVDTTVERVSEYAWDGGGRTSAVARNGRATKSLYDSAGRLVRHAAGAGTVAALTDVFSRSTVEAHEGALPASVRNEERGGSAYLASTEHGVLGSLTRESIGPLTWTRLYDELGNVSAAAVPARPPTEWQRDGRGAVELETLPDNATNRYAFDANGAQTAYHDPSIVPETTRTVRDRIGRPLRREYPDGTNETIEWQGPRVRSVTDRQGRRQIYDYNTRGQLDRVLDDSERVIEVLTYDDAGRLISWKTADVETTWGDFNAEGAPKKTSQRRFRDGSGMAVAPEVLDVYEQSHTYNEHGERTSYSMPAAPGVSLQSPWRSSVSQSFDAMGNLTSIDGLMTATYRNAGRPAERIVTTAGGATVTRRYDYEAESGLIRSMAVDVDGRIVAGSEVTHDGLQIGSARLLGVSAGQRAMKWTYDARSRLASSAAGVFIEADVEEVAPGEAAEELTRADFRDAQLRRSLFDEEASAKLQCKEATEPCTPVDVSGIDPPSADFEENPGGGHKVGSVSKGPAVLPFVWNGAERIDDGRFVYEFDIKGRLVRATQKGPLLPLRRLTYSYSGAGRVVGRRAEYALTATPAPEDWRLEDRPAVLSADGLPGDTTFVWDAVSDNLVAVFGADGTLLKQVLHGGMSYDDPLETASLDRTTGTVARLYGVYDEAGAGTLQAVFNEAGEVVARTLPNDPYGASGVDFTGAAIDGSAAKFVRDNDGDVESVEVTMHATEELDPSTLPAGARLAAVDKNGIVVRASTVNPTLVPGDPFTVRWTLNAEQWAALTDPAPSSGKTPEQLSIAATSTLRAEAWSSALPILPAPDWIQATRAVYTSSELPVEIRESFGSLGDAITSGAEEHSLYAIDALTLVGTPGGADAVITAALSARFQALPFAEPVTGLVYARARWLDPLTGTFLSPDPMRYRDSSNLYAFAGGDPVNGRDPEGLADHARIRLAQLKASLKTDNALCKKNVTDTRCIAPIDAWLAEKLGDASAVLIRENQYGSGTPIVYVNGILTPREDNETTARRLARIFAVPIYSVWNPSTGSMVVDGAELFLLHKRNVVDASTLLLIQTVREVLLTNSHVTVMAHSQGAAIASSALSFLTDAERAKVDVVTFGGAAYAYPIGTRSLRVIANVQDLVPWLFGYLGRYGVARPPELERTSFGRLRIFSFSDTHSILEYLDAMEQALSKSRMAAKRAAEHERRLVSVPALGRVN